MTRENRNATAHPLPQLLGIVLAAMWCVLVMALSSRNYFLVNYGSMRSLVAWLEPFAASWASSIVALCVMIAWTAMRRHIMRSDAQTAMYSAICLAVALIAGLPWIASWTTESVRVESIWPIFWLAAWTGLSFAVLARGLRSDVANDRSPIRSQPRIDHLQSSHLSFAVTVAMSLACGCWWTTQSFHYYSAYMLGFNDFGHFMQRVANTANGHGFLLETPVLPIFWDHFNPGLVLLVPLWQLFPDVTLCFYLQSASLALSAVCIWRISRNLGQRPRTSAMWGTAWLMQPVVGQMNLAYSYGWHPISFAIPLLLITLIALQTQRYALGATSLLLALSMEEGVFVIAALFCAVNFAIAKGLLGSQSEQSNSISGALHWRSWLACCVILAIGFMAVFRWSGLAEFQTGRFSSLGGTPLQVLASPILRPHAFWGQLFGMQNAYLTLGLFLPCFLPSLVRGWRWCLAIVLPLGVLLVWEHRPAQSLAFQYSSTLLPILWLASMYGARDQRSTSEKLRWNELRFGAESSSMGAFATALTLSIFLGQMPFSARTLVDVQTRTYEPTELEQRLLPGSPEHDFLTELIKKIRTSGGEVLATGRIASHCVGNRDVETVGQYVQRRSMLSKLAGREDGPIRHYEWVIVDRQEGFQQTAEEIRAVERETIRAGFQKLEDRHAIALYRRP
ncbi:MAG: DUF2079 domain-containing protein [Pirellula sp.]